MTTHIALRTAVGLSAGEDRIQLRPNIFAAVTHILRLVCWILIFSVDDNFIAL